MRGTNERREVSVEWSTAVEAAEGGAGDTAGERARAPRSEPVGGRLGAVGTPSVDVIGVDCWDGWALGFEDVPVDSTWARAEKDSMVRTVVGAGGSCLCFVKYDARKGRESERFWWGL